VGVALFLTNLAYKKVKVSELRAAYPEYVIAKNKIELSDSALIDNILETVKAKYAAEDINTIDGVKISFEERKEWVHLRRSNTEPIIRIFAEAATAEAAGALAKQIIDIADTIIK
jgi:phosphomannomutase